MYVLYDKKAKVGVVSEDMTQIGLWLEVKPDTVRKWLYEQNLYESERYIIFKANKILKTNRGGKGNIANLEIGWKMARK